VPFLNIHFKNDATLHAGLPPGGGGLSRRVICGGVSIGGVI